MRQLITDPRLFKMLDEIESWLGRTIPKKPMPLAHRANALCTTYFSPDEIFSFYYIPEESLSQTILCHELAHVVLMIEGGPMYRVTRFYPMIACFDYALNILLNLIPHIGVWKLVKTIGFDETANSRREYEELIEYVQSGNFLIEAHPDVLLQCRAIYLAHLLSAPCESEMRKSLRSAASRTMPTALESADSIRQALERLEPASQPSFAVVLQDILDMLGFPTGILQPSYLSKVDPCFRSRILV
jgi:hypothetical protein